MFGSKSVPPARGIAFVLSPSRIRAASSSVRGAQGFWPVDMRKMARSKSRFTSSFLFGQRLHDFFRCYGNFIDPYSDGIVDSVSHRWHDWQKGPLPNFLCAKGPARIRFLDQLGDHVGHIERRRALVFKD